MNGANENGISEDVRNDALKLCGDYLGGPWASLSSENFKFSTVSGGLSNTLYHCSLPEEGILESNIPREVLLRIYGPLQDDIGVILAESAIFLLLSERNLGPRLYGIFPKGRLEEYIPSRSLKRTDIRILSTSIAREMAKIHALDVPIKKMSDTWKTSLNNLEASFSKFPGLWSYFGKWLNEIQESVSKEDTATLDLLKLFRTEVDFMMHEMKKQLSSPAFCHNDLQGGNILLREDSAESGEPEIMLIDFEFGGYNYRTFDIANHFCEWCFDYNTEKYPYFIVDFNLFPSKEEQTEYITSYLNQLEKEGNFKGKDFQSELNVILSEITFFAMAAHLMWSLWSVKMAQTSSMDFAHREHGNVRRNQYFNLKEQYLKSKC